MKEMIPDSWTEDEALLLRHEAFVAELLRRRSGSGDNKPPLPWWKRFLETGSGAAFITVLIGGIMGSVITGMIQYYAKEREYQQAWVKARGDQALLAYQEHLKNQHETVKIAYELIGNCISASEDIISLTGEAMAPGASVGIDEKRKNLQDNYDKVDARWRGEQERLGLLIGYYHPRQATLKDEWDKTQMAITTYMNCARDWYIPRRAERLSEETVKANACPTERTALTNQLKAFSKILDESRKYAWEGWETPETLKSLSSTASSP